MVRGSSASLSRTFVDAGVVEQDDLPLRCQRVADGGVEVVEVAHEVLGEDQRGARRGPEAAVGETGAADLEELGESGGGEGSDHVSTVPPETGVRYPKPDCTSASERGSESRR